MNITCIDLHNGSQIMEYGVATWEVIDAYSHILSSSLLPLCGVAIQKSINITEKKIGKVNILGAEVPGYYYSGNIVYHLQSIWDYKSHHSITNYFTCFHITCTIPNSKKATFSVFCDCFSKHLISSLLKHGHTCLILFYEYLHNCLFILRACCTLISAIISETV